jgi:hypothetical protein
VFDLSFDLSIFQLSELFSKCLKLALPAQTCLFLSGHRSSWKVLELDGEVYEELL